MDNKENKCDFCENGRASIHAEVSNGIKVYVCEKCLELSETHFMFVCMSCRTVYKRKKTDIVRDSANIDPQLKIAYARCMEMQIFQGLKVCPNCADDWVSPNHGLIYGVNK